MKAYQETPLPGALSNAKKYFQNRRKDSFDQKLLLELELSLRIPVKLKDFQEDPKQPSYTHLCDNISNNEIMVNTTNIIYTFLSHILWGVEEAEGCGGQWGGRGDFRRVSAFLLNAHFPNSQNQNKIMIQLSTGPEYTLKIIIRL